MIYLSFLKRVFYIVSKIVEGRDIKIIIREDLIEINGGEWEDRCWDEFFLFYLIEYEMWEKMFYKYCMLNGESMYEFFLRVKFVFEDIVKLNVGKRICIVIYGILIRVFLMYIKGYEFERFNEILW